MNRHYVNLEEPIKRYFAKIGKRVEIEPSGSRGPDIKSTDGTVVGEIKHITELVRDLPAKFWRDWNKPEDRIALVKECGWFCDHEYLDRENDCPECPAVEWCEDYQDWLADKEGEQE